MTNEVSESVEARLTAIEDEIAIIRLIASYGPLVDTGFTEPAAKLFREDGVYDIDLGRIDGAQAFSEMLSGDLHQKCVSNGIAHAMGLPWVRLAGERATAINVTQIYLREGDGFKAWRIAQNVWKLEKSPSGWAVVHRTNRLIGGGEEAVELLRSSLNEDNEL